MYLVMLTLVLIVLITVVLWLSHWTFSIELLTGRSKGQCFDGEWTLQHTLLFSVVVFISPFHSTGIKPQMQEIRY